MATAGGDDAVMRVDGDAEKEEEEAPPPPSLERLLDEYEFRLNQAIEENFSTPAQMSFFERPAEVAPGLFLGNMAHAQNVKLLQSLGISGVVNCAFDADTGLLTGPDFYPSRFAFLGFPALDAEDYPILEAHLPALLAFMGEHGRGRRVLIHCMAGMNRSAALLAALLLHQKRMYVEDVVAVLAQKRGSVLSNTGFVRQLAKLAFELDLLEKPGLAAGAGWRAGDASGAA